MRGVLPADNHVHSQFSWDTGAESSMEDTCRRALAVGLPAVAFTEHVDFTEWGADDRPPAGAQISTRRRVQPVDVDGYLASIERCRHQFPDLRILSGIEAGEPHHFAGSVAAVLKSGSFDRVLGSLHSVVHDGKLVFVNHVFGTLPAAVVVVDYFAELLRLVESSDVFEVLAHCDFPRRYWPADREGAYREADFEEEYRTVFRALATSDRPLELNTSSPLASATLMGWWHEEGGGAVSFGSDAHVPLRVGDKFDVAVDIVEAAGFRPGRDEYDFWRR
ncbi:PHP domain-containing protein [Mycolicibacterium hodleri]|uniref:Histidinol-phosphatase n=1 Tax=Mycolicibacterium hodleri TaxID=49897 RepID=A0A502DN60_9MYCO|nr:PHP domain-containing protein [Mycolicibacterium hodleri]TPG25546.1 PHP domain-containing protein [Mycolicibacterium hodleri]